MTIDEAIQHCKEQVQEQAKKGCYSCAEEHRQLAEWLKELKAYRNKSEIPTSCGDAISRADARHLIAETNRKSLGYISTKVFKILYDGIDKLPSVTPQQRTGRWIKQNYGWNWQCSECGFVTPPSAKEIFTFCPKCGAKMEVEE